MRGSRTDARHRRHFRVRKSVYGTAERPRALAVFRSNRHISAQVIDDDAGHTLAAASSQEKGVKGSLTVETATEVGKLIAGRAKDAGVERVVFDRGGNKFHGRVKALAESVREEGLEF